MGKKYSHVIVVGIDGAGSFIKDAKTPVFDQIFKNGAVTYSALASNPSISAECWGSMLVGVGPEVHGLTNQVVSENPYPIDSPFPTLFRRIREAYPQATLGAYCNWNCINFGIVENNLEVSKETGGDDDLTPLICDYIRNQKPDFLFIQFDSVDSAGHRNGYGTPAHLQRISEVDVLVGDIYNAVKEAGMLEDTLFIVIADHGGTPPDEGGRGHHGGWSVGERYVTFAATGKDVAKGNVAEMNVRDLAAIVLYAFDIQAPEFCEKGWTSQVPAGIFADDSLPAYRDISYLTGAAPRISKEPHMSELV